MYLSSTLPLFSFGDNPWRTACVGKNNSLGIWFPWFGLMGSPGLRPGGPQRHTRWPALWPGSVLIGLQPATVSSLSHTRSPPVSLLPKSPSRVPGPWTKFGRDNKYLYTIHS